MTRAAMRTPITTSGVVPEMGTATARKSELSPVTPMPDVVPPCKAPAMRGEPASDTLDAAGSSLRASRTPFRSVICTNEAPSSEAASSD